MSTACGLDFGTSNSTIGIVQHNTCVLVALEDNQPPLPSAIFCDFDSKQFVFGEKGIAAYLDSVPGRLMVSLKSILGTSFAKDETFIFDRFRPYTDLIAQFILHMKNVAEKTAQQSLHQV